MMNEPATPGTDRLFEVGDRVSGVICCDNRDSGRRVIGRLGEIDKNPDSEFRFYVTAEEGKFKGRAFWVWSSSLKPAPAPVEMYGTMPDDLPETLPAGTRWHYSKSNCGIFDREAVLIRDHSDHGTVYQGDSDCSSSRGSEWGKQAGVFVAPDAVDWSLVPRPSQKPVPAQAGPHSCNAGFCPTCDQAPCREWEGYPRQLPITRGGPGFGSSTQPPEPGQSPPDPYVAHRERLELGQIRSVPFVAWCEEQERIASARQSTEREAGVKRFDAWVSVRHAREVK